MMECSPRPRHEASANHGAPGRRNSLMFLSQMAGPLPFILAMSHWDIHAAAVVSLTQAAGPVGRSDGSNPLELSPRPRGGQHVGCYVSGMPRLQLIVSNRAMFRLLGTRS